MCGPGPKGSDLALGLLGYVGHSIVGVSLVGILVEVHRNGAEFYVFAIDPIFSNLALVTGVLRDGKRCIIYLGTYDVRDSRKHGIVAHGILL